ncbi:Rv2175c family DNA-binding protein [Antribacter gilvus]|uniref:Rv2175c family DNA-binding protein n=1 Tax=Antribacter gilvus TaxID=2304675 RepID=UPI000F78245C|nr:Rv2175c family DNA-binding protein [Antribacter gilvus]
MSETAARLDDLVDDWLTLPDLAEVLDIDLGKTRRLVQDRHLVGIKRGPGTTFQVPARFVVPDPDRRPRAGDDGDDADPGGSIVIPTLRGTIVLLSDGGFTDPEIIEWLFTHEDALGTRPVDALASGRRAEVRRVAQTHL